MGGEGVDNCGECMWGIIIKRFNMIISLVSTVTILCNFKICFILKLARNSKCIDVFLWLFNRRFVLL